MTIIGVDVENRAVRRRLSKKDDVRLETGGPKNWEDIVTAPIILEERNEIVSSSCHNFFTKFHFNGRASLTRTLSNENTGLSYLQVQCPGRH